MPQLPGDPPRNRTVPALRHARERVRSGHRAHRHGGSRRAGRAPLVPVPGTCLHDRVSHPVPRVRARAGSAAGRAHLRLAAALPRAGRRGDGGDAIDPRRPPHARVSQSRDVVPRRRHRRVPARTAPRQCLACSRVHVRRPRGGRKEPRRVPPPRPAGHQGGRRRRAAAGRAAVAPPARRVHGREARRGARRALPQCRRVRVSEPDRYVRARAARGDGERHARRRLPRGRTDRRRPARTEWRAG